MQKRINRQKELHKDRNTDSAHWSESDESKSPEIRSKTLQSHKLLTRKLLRNQNTPIKNQREFEKRLGLVEKYISSRSDRLDSRLRNKTRDGLRLKNLIYAKRSPKGTWTSKERKNFFAVLRKYVEELEKDPRLGQAIVKDVAITEYLLSILHITNCVTPFSLYLKMEEDLENLEGRSS